MNGDIGFEGPRLSKFSTLAPIEDKKRHGIWNRLFHGTAAANSRLGVGASGDLKMLKDVMNDSSVNRLKQILADRYGKALEIRQLQEVTDGQGAENVLRGADLHIPLKVSEAFLGTAVIHRGADLGDEARRQVTQMVRMVLEPTLYNVFLQRKENNLKSVESEGFTKVSNVEIFEEAPAPEYEPISESAEPTVTHLIHLQGSQEIQIRKVAHTIHEMAERWAFVPFADLQARLHCIDDIIRLGTMTIFIENIETLSEGAQELICEYLSSPRKSDDPLLISTSRIDSKSLAESGRLRSELADEVAVNCFDTERAPITTHGLKEVLDLLYFKESSPH